MPGLESPGGGPSLPERLFLAMRRAGLSQTDLAAHLHTDSRVLRRYLSGERTPPPEITAAWERVCGLAPGELSASGPHVDPEGVVADRGRVLAARRPWTRRMVVAAGLGVVVVAVVGVGVAVVAWRLGASSAGAGAAGPPPRPGLQPCPSRPRGTGFTGRTFEEGVVVRGGAGQDFPAVGHLPGDCDLGFWGYCIGQPVKDVFGGTLDSRWFVIRSSGPLDTGLVASAVINGNPPVDMAPMACAGSRETPPHIDLRLSSAPDLPGQLQLDATAPGADIVGFAAYTSIAGATSPSPLWQQLGFAQAGPDFTIRLNQPGDPPLGVGDVTVVAVVCLASEAPTATEASTVLRMLADGTATLPDAARQPETGAAARQAACRYPSHPDGVPAPTGS